MGVARQRTRIVLVGMLLAVGGFALGALFGDQLGGMGTAVPALVVRATRSPGPALATTWQQSEQALGSLGHGWAALAWLGSGARISGMLGGVLGLSLIAVVWHMRSRWLRQRLRPHAPAIVPDSPPAMPPVQAYLTARDVTQPVVTAGNLGELVQSIQAFTAVTSVEQSQTSVAGTAAPAPTSMETADVAGTERQAPAAARSTPSVCRAEVLAEPAQALAPAPEPEPPVTDVVEEAPRPAWPDHGAAYVALLQEREESRQRIRTVIDDAVAGRRAAQARAALIAELLARESTREIAADVTPRAAGASYTLDAWTNDDRALACATLVHRLLMAHAIPDGIVALDVTDRQVQVFLELPQTAPVSVVQLAQDLGAQQASWQVWADHGLMMTLPEAPSLPHGPWLPVLPVLAMDRKARSVRYVPASRWPHLGVYGGAAVTVAHHLLTSLLCQAAPQSVGLQFLDTQHLIDTVYADAPHTVRCTASASQTLQHIIQDVRRDVLAAVRPLVLVVVEPDPALVPLLINLVRLLRHQPRIPLRLVVVQPAVHPACRDIYGMLGAGVITAQGNGQASLIPGLQRWPQAGRALVFQHTFQWEGFPMTMEQPDARGIVRSLPRGPYMLPPVIGDADRSDAATTLAAVMATAGQEVVRPGAVPASADSSRHNGTEQDTDNAAQARAPRHVPASAGNATPQPAIPTKPAGWLDADRTALVTALVTDSTISGGQHPGVTRSRIQQALPEHLKARSRQVLLWLDAAGLLSPPIKAEQPYRHPRALRTLDRDELEAALRATPVPEQAAHIPGGGR